MIIMNRRKSWGDGRNNLHDLNFLGSNVIIEDGVRIFNPQNIAISNNVYIGHDTILNGYLHYRLYIGEHTWIGQQCYIHAAGDVHIGSSVGIGPGVKIITSYHEERYLSKPVVENPLRFRAVIIGAGADIGVGSILLPGAVIGEGAIIGAGSVVTGEVPPYSVYAGVPAKFLRERKGEP